jgi:hypothetical protein
MPPTKKNVKATRRKPAAKAQESANAGSIATPVSAAAAPVKSTRRTIHNYDGKLWSTTMCAAWSGLAVSYIVRLIRTGQLQAVALGPACEQHTGIQGIVHRRCAKYMVFSAPFKEFVENLGVTGRLTRSA